MEVYIVVPDDLNQSHHLIGQAARLFERQRKMVSIYSSFQEKMIGFARELALSIGIDFSVDQFLGENPDTIRDFQTKHFWPNHLIEIVVVPLGVAQIIVKSIDPGCASDAIPLNTLFRLKDTFPVEQDDEL